MLKKYTSRAERLKKPLSFLMIDVDLFREINSRFGHTTGDFVLLEVATILKSAVRGSDAVVRYGGDEFLVILADAPPEDVELRQKAHRPVRAGLEPRRAFEGF